MNFPESWNPDCFVIFLIELITGNTRLGMLKHSPSVRDLSVAETDTGNDRTVPEA